MSSPNIIDETKDTTDEGPLELETPVLTPEQEKENSIKVAKMHQVALNQLIQLGLRNYIAMLSAPKTSGAKRLAIAQSLERAIMAGLDYGVDVAQPQLNQKGEFAKVENSFAAHIARCKENGMIITAYNYEKAEIEKEATIKTQEGTENGEIQGNEKIDEVEANEEGLLNV